MVADLDERDGLDCGEFGLDVAAAAADTLAAEDALRCDQGIGVGVTNSGSRTCQLELRPLTEKLML